MTRQCQEISLKKIYDEITDDIFDMSNVRIFKEIEREKKRDVYTLLCLRLAELSKAFGLIQNICSDASRVQDYWNLAKARVRPKKYALCPNAAYLKSSCHTCL